MDARDPEMAVVYLDLPPVSQLREGETLRLSGLRSRGPRVGETPEVPDSQRPRKCG